MVLSNVKSLNAEMETAVLFDIFYALTLSSLIKEACGVFEETLMITQIYLYLIIIYIYNYIIYNT